MPAEYQHVLNRFQDVITPWRMTSHRVQLPTHIESVVVFDFEGLDEDHPDRVEENFWPDGELEVPEGAMLFGALGFAGWGGGEWMNEMVIYGALLFDLLAGDGDDCPVLWYQTREPNGDELDEPHLTSIGLASALFIEEGYAPDDDDDEDAPNNDDDDDE